LDKLNINFDQMDQGQFLEDIEYIDMLLGQRHCFLDIEHSYLHENILQLYKEYNL